MTKWRGLVLGLLLATSGGIASAQQGPIQTQPLTSTSLGGDASGTITTTNTFQKIFSAASTSNAPVVGTASTRHGCSIQNNGTNNMYVNEGTAIGSATTSNTWVVAAGNTFSCNFGGVVLVGEIDITGTSGDAFVAKQF